MLIPMLQHLEAKFHCLIYTYLFLRVLTSEYYKIVS